MFEREDETVERVIQHLRKPMAIDPGLDARVMGEIAQAPSPKRRARLLLPLLAAAAVLATVLIVARPWIWNSASKTDALQFVLVAPQAASVALVGDFNDWDPARAPMQTAHGAGIWATVVRLAPGRYRYA